MIATAALTRDVKVLAGLFVTSGVVHPRTRKLAGWASLGVLLTVYPANFKMAGAALRAAHAA